MKAGTLLLGLSFLISKLLGLLRDTLLAAQFGAGAHIGGIFNLDTYYAAFRVPDFLFNMLSYGILSAAFVPLFVEIKKKEGDVVSRGEVVALSGNTGYSIEPHLHFAIKVNNESVDPLRFIEEINKELK